MGRLPEGRSGISLDAERALRDQHLRTRHRQLRHRSRRSRLDRRPRSLRQGPPDRRPRTPPSRCSSAWRGRPTSRATSPRPATSSSPTSTTRRSAPTTAGSAATASPTPPADQRFWEASAARLRPPDRDLGRRRRRLVDRGHERRRLARGRRRHQGRRQGRLPRETSAGARSSPAWSCSRSRPCSRCFGIRQPPAGRCAPPSFVESCLGVVMRPRDRIERLASSSHGVVNRAQLLAAGLTEAQIKRRLRSGELLQEYRGVYRVGHRAPSVEARYLAAVWACGRGALLSGRAAGHLLGDPRHASLNARGDSAAPSAASRASGRTAPDRASTATILARHPGHDPGAHAGRPRLSARS